MIRVVKPGLLATIQDEGRYGFQAYGVPVAGAMDKYAYRVANMLVGNRPGAAVLEMTVAGAQLFFESDMFVAICGADMQGKLNGKTIANWSCFKVSGGSELLFDYAVCGCRTYIAIHGGIDVPVVLGSRSTYTRAGIGGVEGRALKYGDILHCGNEGLRQPQEVVLDSQFIPNYPEEIVLRVIPGPQADYFTDSGIKAFFSNKYTISLEADRMGYRMEGPLIAHKERADIVSDALCRGAIQVPGHGKPIVMMMDTATTGGYAKIGTVIGPDIVGLAQSKPGQKVVFRQCSDELAEFILRSECDTLDRVDSYIANYSKADAKFFAIKVGEKIFNVKVEEV